MRQDLRYVDIRIWEEYFTLDNWMSFAKTQFAGHGSLETAGRWIMLPWWAVAWRFC